MSEHETDDSPLAGPAADITLVDRARAGHTGAFEELVRRYRNDVFALSYHFLRNREEAWDVSQEVFIKAYHSLRNFRGDSSFKTWLLRITANHCKDHFKKRKLDTVPLDERLDADAPGLPPNPREAMESAELGAAIEKAIALLPPKHRTAFVLREFEGMSYQDMAEVMHCNVGTVMSRLHHARQKLQSMLMRMGVMEGG
jgi:RNA polymerase sigma-70 factor, ECF subfamily